MLRERAESPRPQMGLQNREKICILRSTAHPTCQSLSYTGLTGLTDAGQQSNSHELTQEPADRAIEPVLES